MRQALVKNNSIFFNSQPAGFGDSFGPDFVPDSERLERTLEAWIDLDVPENNSGSRVFDSDQMSAVDARRQRTDVKVKLWGQRSLKKGSFVDHFSSRHKNGAVTKSQTENSRKLNIENDANMT